MDAGLRIFEVDMQVLLALALVFSQASSGMLYFARQVPEDVDINGWLPPSAPRTSSRIAHPLEERQRMWRWDDFEI